MDKKYLLGTTSLVAAAVLGGGNALAEAQPLNLSLSGYYNFDVHIADEDQEGGADNGSMTTAQDAEINFNMRGELDNGMKIGGRIELEASNGGDQIDQHWLTLEAGWGRIDVGAVNSARYNLSWTVNAPNVAHGITSGTQTEWLTINGGNIGNYFRRPFGSANVDAGNDSQGISYYSPRFNGFLFGITYRPQVSTTGGGGSGGSNTKLADENTAYHDAFDLVVHYSGDLGGVGLTALAGYFTASQPNNSQAGGNPFGFDDYEGVNGGLVLSFEGFRVGGMIADVSEGFCVNSNAAADIAANANGLADCADTADVSTEGTAYTLGASYGSGPWAVSATVHDGEIEDAQGIAGDSTNETWAIGASYTLGPGIRLIASYVDIEYDNEDNIAANGNDGETFSLGVALGF